MRTMFGGVPTKEIAFIVIRLQSGVGVSVGVTVVVGVNVVVAVVVAVVVSVAVGVDRRRRRRQLGDRRHVAHTVEGQDDGELPDEAPAQRP